MAWVPELIAACANSTREGAVKSAPHWLKGFAEEAFELRLKVLVGFGQVTVGGIGRREGIDRCRKA